MVAGGEEREKRSSTCNPHESSPLIEQRKAMEDFLPVSPGDLPSYDGHGGAKMACACLDRLHKLLAREIEDGRKINGEASEVDDRLLLIQFMEKLQHPGSLLSLENTRFSTSFLIFPLAKHTSKVQHQRM